MAVAAETVRVDSFEEIISQESWRPLVINVAELESDDLMRAKTVQFIGAVALGENVITSEVRSAKAWSLQDAIHEAANGNHEARKMTETNVKTDVVERTLKAGHVIDVPMEIGRDGEIRQYGQSAADIQANSLRFATKDPQMRARTEVETRNMFRIQEALSQGLLEEYNFVVFSRAADDMPESAMQEAGFFTDTMSCAIQKTGLADGQLQVESAFVAGKKSWDAPRHDGETMGRVGDMLGIDLHDKTATQLLDTPLLIHKSLMPNGVIDVVQIYDNAAGDTFFGQAKPREDYVGYGQKCREREASFEPRVQAITRQLIAKAHEINSPQAACTWLNKLSQKEMLEHSIQDKTIDARVFGVEAAFRIEHARYFYERGDMARVEQAVTQAQQVAHSYSCAGGVGGEGAAGEEEGESSNSVPDDCEFVSEECPKCHAKKVKTVVKRGKYYGACGCVG